VLGFFVRKPKSSSFVAGLIMTLEGGDDGHRVIALNSLGELWITLLQCLQHEADLPVITGVVAVASHGEDKVIPKSHSDVTLGVSGRDKVMRKIAQKVGCLFW